MESLSLWIAQIAFTQLFNTLDEKIQFLKNLF